ncbi:hypothetical protein GPECTOR_287g767 [Gonium pectorale]|uniref:Uncharacterized protein n=1 Tax=Gonium pectorale TaxID=33097 RepID=A0A150FVZ3_GONPE|nr:hypothetical protein GPECTOR_287g767 [Gonium pectorale]|eukprot:KXZ41776.1 hypothetical protein GPECTOR_287g767 [Gonium pectorale]
MPILQRGLSTVPVGLGRSSPLPAVPIAAPGSRALLRGPSSGSSFAASGLLAPAARRLPAGDSGRPRSVRAVGC